MNAKTFLLLILLSISSKICFGQTNNVESMSNSGADVAGVRLTISLTNNLIGIGSIATLSAQITNYSEDSIFLFIAEPRISDFKVYLTDRLNKKYTIVELSGGVYSVMIVQIGPRESGRWLVPLKIGKEIKPGKYWLTATRRFRAASEYHMLESYALTVDVN